jgi:hypothetical protein
MMIRFASNDEGYLDGERYMQSDLLIIPSRLNLKTNFEIINLSFIDSHYVCG